MLTRFTRGFVQIVLGLALVFILFAANSAPTFAQKAEVTQVTTILLVRYADRGDGDFLTPAGKARAEELIQVLDKADIKAIFVTDTERSRQTAILLADHLGLSAIEYNGILRFTRRILSEYKGQVVFVVGHSNTLPLIAEAFGGSPENCQVSDNEFDNLCVISVYADNKVKVVNLQYGKPSP